VDRKVLLEAVGRPWYIEPQAAAHYADVIRQLFDREAITAFADDEPLELSFAVNAKAERIGTVADANSEGVAVINMRGPVMKYDFCGSPGTQSMIKAVEQANANPAIKGILFQIDSPGGAVDGSYQLHDAIKNSSKPTGTFVNGKMCSAAMLFGSATNFRTASSAVDMLGSIGTMMSWKDFTKADAAQGIETHEVYATNSTNKNIGFREVKEKGSYDALKAELLDPTNDEFTNTIQANLPNADKSVLNGSVYLAREAKKKGLIDNIGTFDSAVKQVLKLAKKTQTSAMNNTFQAAQKVAGVESFLPMVPAVATQVEAEGIYIPTEQMQMIDAALASGETAQAQLSENVAALSAANESLATANTSLEAANATIIELQAQITTLKDGDAVNATDAAAKADKFKQDDSEKHITSVDRELAQRKAKYKV
jgi:ClpP class serine protease